MGSFIKGIFYLGKDIDRFFSKRKFGVLTG